MGKPYHHIEATTCHDIRKLVLCCECKGVGRKDHMVPVSGTEYSHGRCYIKSNGMEAFIELPENVTSRLYLDDIGVKAMKRLMANSG